MKVAPEAGVVLTLLSRGYCHLCDDMAEAVAPIAAAHGVPVDIVDVDAHPALDEAWGELVPVLLLGGAGDGIELCHYHLDVERVTRAIVEACGNRPADVA